MTDGRSADVVIVGAGPSGLTAAREIAAAGCRSVLVLERESAAGGIPRHCAHPGFGIHDLHRVLSGGAYARQLVAGARAAGAEIRTGAMVTGWADDGVLLVTSPRGRERISANAVILATGARERPRSARLVAGDRGAGIFTTGQLQNKVHLYDQPIGARAVVVGAESVSFSAVMTLRKAGCRTVAMVSEVAGSETYWALKTLGRAAGRFPVLSGQRLVEIVGRPRVSAIRIQDLATGAMRVIACDTVVLTADWIPDNELSRARGVEIDRDSLAPVVDGRFRTTVPGVFAVGNLVHPVDTADHAALDGRVLARALLATGVDHAPAGSGNPNGDAAIATAPRLLAGPSLQWITPGIFTGLGKPASEFRAWVRKPVLMPEVVVRQDGRRIGSVRTPWPAARGRIFRIPTRVFSGANPHGGVLTVDLER